MPGIPAFRRLRQENNINSKLTWTTQRDLVSGKKTHLIVAVVFMCVWKTMSYILYCSILQGLIVSQLHKSLGIIQQISPPPDFTSTTPKPNCIFQMTVNILLKRIELMLRLHHSLEIKAMSVCFLVMFSRQIISLYRQVSFLPLLSRLILKFRTKFYSTE